MAAFKISFHLVIRRHPARDDMILEEQKPSVKQENTTHRLISGLSRREALSFMRWEQRNGHYRFSFPCRGDLEGVDFRFHNQEGCLLTLSSKKRPLWPSVRGLRIAVVRPLPRSARLQTCHSRAATKQRMLSSFFNRHEVALAGAKIDLSRTCNLLIRIKEQLLPLSQPS